MYNLTYEKETKTDCNKFKEKFEKYSQAVEYMIEKKKSKEYFNFHISSEDLTQDELDIINNKTNYRGI